MKKKNLKYVNEIIVDLTKLETLLAQQSSRQKFADQDKILEWFGILNKATSRLDDFYKKEMGIK